MVRFTFANGKVHEFDYDWLKLSPKLQMAGMKMFRPEYGVLIPLNSHTVAMIEYVDVELTEEEKELSDKLTKKLVKEVAKEEEAEEVTVEEVIEKKTPLSIQEKNELILKEMKEMSECTHENMEYHYQQILSGPKNAQKPMRRYFPVCVKCGMRERYVKAESLTDDEKLNAKVWDK
jgi:DNA-directed RNA polymerase subunit M/transcription elongation factor TFIIS